jgi:4a-hydroxytetrahydrobiopterin dehydratase
MAEQTQLEKLSKGRRAELMESVPDWERDGEVISRELVFEDFRASLAFVERVADLAEEQGHHPDIFVSINHVHLFLTTHKVHRLTEKDFALASAIDRLL